MALRNFISKLHPSATGTTIIKDTDPHKGTRYKGILAGAGVVVTGGTNDVTIATDATGATVGSSVTVRQSATLSATSGDTGVTLTNLAGLVVTVVPGTYAFTCNLGTVATTNSGLKVGFKLTTTVLTSIEYQATGGSATGNVASRGTTATDQMSLYAATAATLVNRITGTMVVGTGGTIQLQGAQNASHADTTSVFLGSSMTFTRIA